MTRVGGVVKLVAPDNIVARTQGALSASGNCVGHTQVKGVAACAAAKRHHEHPLARPGHVENAGQSDHRGACVGVADVVGQQPRRELPILEAQLATGFAREFGVGLMEDDVRIK